MNPQPIAAAPLGRVVRAALADAGYSLRLASEATGIALPTLNRRCLGGDFRWSELKQLAELIGTRPSHLLAEAERVEVAA